MAIYSALNLLSVQNLKSTWKVVHRIFVSHKQHVSRKSLHLIAEIEHTVDATRNFKNYREMLKEIEEPFVPFEGKIDSSKLILKACSYLTLLSLRKIPLSLIIC